MKTHIARTAGVVVAVLALDYLLLVGIGLFLTKVLGKDSVADRVRGRASTRAWPTAAPRR